MISSILGIGSALKIYLESSQKILSNWNENLKNPQTTELYNIPNIQNTWITSNPICILYYLACPKFWPPLSPLCTFTATTTAGDRALASWSPHVHCRGSLLPYLEPPSLPASRHISPLFWREFSLFSWAGNNFHRVSSLLFLHGSFVAHFFFWGNYPTSWEELKRPCYQQVRLKLTTTKLLSQLRVGAVQSFRAGTAARGEAPSDQPALPAGTARWGEEPSVSRRANRSWCAPFGNPHPPRAGWEREWKLHLAESGG